MALIIALALMTGLQGELRDRILGSTRARVRRESAGGCPTTGRKSQDRGDPGVVGAAPAILGERRSSTRASSVRSSRSRASTRRSRAKVTDIQRAMRIGSLDDSGAGRRRDATGSSSATISPRRSARASAIRCSCSTPAETLTPMGMLPRARRLQGRRHLQPRPVRVRLRVRLRRLRVARAPARPGASRTSSSCGVDDIYARASDRRVDPGAARAATTRPRTGPT